ncbi:MAG: Uma2 family endonuclease [Bacteroidota bacterium]
MDRSENRHYTLEEWQELLKETGERYEYLDGRLNYLGGKDFTSWQHSKVVRNLVGELHILTKGTGWLLLNSQMKIMNEEASEYNYADALIFKSKADILKLSDEEGMVNPYMIFEVVSDEDIDYKKGEKMYWYFAFPTLLEYVVIHCDKAEAWVFRRLNSKSGIESKFHQGLNASIELKSISINLPLESIYNEVELSN